MTATVFERNSKSLTTIVAFFLPDLIYLYFYVMWIKFIFCLLLIFMVLNCGRKKMYLQCISHLRIFYSVQVQSAHGMSVFPVAVGICNLSSMILFSFSFRG